LQTQILNVSTGSEINAAFVAIAVGNIYTAAISGIDP
jgi:hypothetical protein